ncbi:hypothetical protein, partial [Bacillus anthracis]|uniref:hypothetical protein n=1 Tax=Bacillus anthracis TaxID=1392 RepID=UPI000E1599AA
AGKKKPIFWGFPRFFFPFPFFNPPKLKNITFIKKKKKPFFPFSPPEKNKTGERRGGEEGRTRGAPDH